MPWHRFLIALTALLAYLVSHSDAIISSTAYQPDNDPNYDGTGKSTGRANFTFEELYKYQVRFWENFVNNNTDQANSINSTLIASDCLGRVDATRTFDGQELNTEYLFGLFANLKTSNTPTILGVPVSYNIIHFTANQDISTAATVVFFHNAFMGVFPVEIDSWILWNQAGQIRQYDATYRWFGNLLDATLALAANSSATQDAEENKRNNNDDDTDHVTSITESLATSICTTTQTYCNGTNAQYASFNACYTTLTQQKRFGKAYELGADTLLCRLVHQNMVALRPAVHCPHVGPTGGGMCVDDLHYAERVLQKYFVHAPFLPEGYESGNASIDAW
ncbi:hypothetical protein B0J12DRAFT_379230 [Macrophomina phaseolina]|uniref:Secreted protein n=1 Tax=Macrophomina phaseolina TaxID=35725 RepID=A0ABQ8GN68_9PEZI|nr:hypothetical protein B0J12DRAFT_379230 [Macrophomina phaseolina]